MPKLYFRSTKSASSTSTTFPGPPKPLDKFQIKQHKFLGKKIPINNSFVSCNTKFPFYGFQPPHFVGSLKGGSNLSMSQMKLFKKITLLHKYSFLQEPIALLKNILRPLRPFQIGRGILLQQIEVIGRSRSKTIVI